MANNGWPPVRAVNRLAVIRNTMTECDRGLFRMGAVGMVLFR